MPYAEGDYSDDYAWWEQILSMRTLYQTHIGFEHRLDEPRVIYGESLYDSRRISYRAHHASHYIRIFNELTGITIAEGSGRSAGEAIRDARRNWLSHLLRHYATSGANDPAAGDQGDRISQAAEQWASSHPQGELPWGFDADLSELQDGTQVRDEPDDQVF